MAVTPGRGGVQQHADGVGEGIGRDQVHLSIAVQVARGHAERVTAAGRDRLRGLEGAVAVAEEQGQLTWDGLRGPQAASVRPSLLKSPTASPISPN